jgi:hypothetical protein
VCFEVGLGGTGGCGMFAWGENDAEGVSAKEEWYGVVERLRRRDWVMR